MNYGKNLRTFDVFENEKQLKISRRTWQVTSGSLTAINTGLILSIVLPYCLRFFAS